MANDGNPRRLSMVFWCFGLITVLSVVWPVYRAFLNIEIDVNEGWNAYFDDAAMGRMPLYPSHDQLITNNYPPLSFYLVGAAGRLVGDPILAGRLLSLASVAIIGVAVALVILLFGNTPAAAAIGGVYFVATVSRFFAGYVGMNDPHLLGQAVMSLGFALFVRATTRDRGYWVSVLLMVLAGFIKHNLWVMPLTAIAWLGLYRPRQLVKSGLLAACAIAAGFALCLAAFGHDFFVNLMAPRAIHWKHFFGSIGHLQWVSVGLVVWCYVGVVRRSDPGVRMCNLMIGIGVVNYLLQKIGAGVDYNAQFELVFAVSVGVGLAFAQAPFLPLAKRYLPETLRFFFLLAICLRLVASTNFESVRLLIDASFREEIAMRERAVSATLAHIRTIPGDVASRPFLCYRAGKPFAVDSFNANQRILAGDLPPDAINKLVASGRLTIVDCDPLVTWSIKRHATPKGSGK